MKILHCPSIAGRTRPRISVVGLTRPRPGLSPQGRRPAVAGFSSKKTGVFFAFVGPLLVLLAVFAVPAFAVFATPAFAVEPSEMLDDPVLEARAREISKGLRCVVCQNQSIDESNADLARDMRILVRERLVAGDSNEEVVAYMVSRYGDFVLLNPPFKRITYALWFGPPLFGVIGIIAVFLFYKRRQSETSGMFPAKLTESEEKRLDKMLGNDEA